MARVELLPHQRTAADKLSNGKVLVGGVGTGKTVTALAYYWEQVLGGVLDDWDTIQTPVDIYVLTTARKRDDLDWQKWGAKFGIGHDTDWSLRGIKLTVDSYNNIEKYKEVKNAFFIFDEQRLVGAGSWSKAFIKIAKANRWVLLSATPGDTWEDYIPLFVANGFYKNRSQFKREHIVYSPYSKFPKVERYLGEGKLLRLKRQILVEMPYARHTTRHIHETVVDHNVDLFEKAVKKRWNVYEERPLRDVAELFSVMRRIVNSDESRLRKIQELSRTHPRLIVFYNFDYELEMLRTLATDGIPAILTTSTITGTESWPDSRERKSRSSLGLNSRTGSGTRSTSGTGLTTKSPSESETTSSDKSSRSIRTSRDYRMSFGDGTTNVQPTMDSSLSCSTPSSGVASVENGALGRNQSSLDVGFQTTLDGSITAITKKHIGDSDRKKNDASFQIAEWNSHRHNPVPDSDRWIYLVQYVAGAEAWDCITTDSVVFYSLTYSYKNFMQAQGRIDRLNTPYFDLHYYVLRSNSGIDKAIMKSLRNKKDFNERDFGK